MCLFFVSALTKQRLLKALEATVKVMNRQQRIATSKFNNTLKELKHIRHLQQKGMCTNMCMHCQHQHHSLCFCQYATV
jgi:predicted GTPase